MHSTLREQLQDSVERIVNPRTVDIGSLTLHERPRLGGYMGGGANGIAVLVTGKNGSSTLRFGGDIQSDIKRVLGTGYVEYRTGKGFWVVKACNAADRGAYPIRTNNKTLEHSKTASRVATLPKSMVKFLRLPPSYHWYLAPSDWYVEEDYIVIGTKAAT